MTGKKNVQGKSAKTVTVGKGDEKIEVYCDDVEVDREGEGSVFKDKEIRPTLFHEVVVNVGIEVSLRHL